MMKKIIITLSMLLICNCLLVGQAYGKVIKVPTYLDSSPKNKTINVKVDSKITVKFLRPIKKGPSFSKIQLKFGKNIIENSLVAIKGNELSIKPNKIMKYNGYYTISIPSNSIVDYTGGSLKKAISVNFKTIAKPSINNKNGDGTLNNTKVLKTDTNIQVTTAAITTKPAVEPSLNVPIQPSSKKSLELHAFYSGNTKFSADTENYMKQLNSVSFAWLTLENENGKVILNEKKSTMDFHKPDNYIEPLNICKANKIPAQIAVFSDGNTAKSIISNLELRKDLIEKLVYSLKLQMPNGDNFDFDGVVIDFEGFRQADTGEYFSAFLKELNTRLHGINKKLYVAVNVRSYWPGYNYKEILKYADKVILMAHDYEPNMDLLKSDILKYINYDGKNPINSLAPISRVKSDLEDLMSSSNDKTDMDKIWLQLSFGISQWQFQLDKIENWDLIDSSALGIRTSPNNEMLMNRVGNKDKLGINLINGYIKELESPYLTYYNLESKTYNFMIYEDSRSIKSKIDLSKLEGISGISLWRLGNIPDYGDEMSQKFYLNVWNTIIESIR